MTALVARARGLGTSLLDATVAAELARAPTFGAVYAVLARAGLAGEPLDAPALDRLACHRIAGDLGTLARWTDTRSAPVLDLLVLDEDRHSIRAILRAVAAGIPVELRAVGAVPTPRLPGRTLGELARAATVPDLAAALARRGHPLAAALTIGPGAPDLLALEVALARGFAQHVRKPRDPALASYLAQIVDAQNAATVRVLAARASRLAPADAFLAGGTRLDLADVTAAATGSRDAADHILARAFAATPLTAALASSIPSAFEDAMLAWQLAEQHARRRLEPLGAAPVIHLVLARRREARQLRRAAWRLALAGTA